MAKKIMFERDDQGDVGLLRKQSRRETWCPGKSSWAAPPGAGGSLLADAPSSSGKWERPHGQAGQCQCLMLHGLRWPPRANLHAISLLPPSSSLSAH